VDYVEPQYHQILFRLADAGVEFIGVGMVSAILQGVPLTTMDLDIVHRRSPENVERLLRVLADLEAVARNDLISTRFGDFNCHGAIDGGRGYEDLLSSSVSLEFEGRTFQFLHLREVLAVKKRAGRPKDLAAIPYIESTIDEIERNA